jgi:hypothetical protein
VMKATMMSDEWGLCTVSVRFNHIPRDYEGLSSNLSSIINIKNDCTIDETVGSSL